MQRLIASVTYGIPAALSEVLTLGRAPNKCAADISADFDRSGTSKGPGTVIIGCLEHLRGSTVGFRNRAGYIARSPLEIGGFRLGLHPGF